MAAKHYSDSQLLGLLDGQCSPYEKARSWFHLRRCWTCRGRMAELESTAQRFALALQEDDYPGRDRVDRAKQEFLDAINVGVVRIEQPFPVLRKLLSSHRAAWLVPTLGAGLLLAATGTVGFFAIWSLAPSSKPPTNARPKSAGAVALPRPIQTQPFTVGARLPEVGSSIFSPSPEAASSVQLEAAEIEARYALHRANLDFSPIEYLREPGVLTIRGFDANQAKALAFLGQRNYVRLRFEASFAPEGTVVRVESPASAARAPIEERLEAWFAKQAYASPADRNRAYAAYLNEVVSFATKGQRAASRLQRLAIRYHGATLAEYSAEHRWLLEAMISDHLGVLDIVTDRQRLLLEQVFPHQAEVREIQFSGPEVWADICLDMAKEASASQALIIELFTLRDTADRDVDQAVSLLQSQLTQWPGLRAHAETVISRQFKPTQEKP
jgi:hypothetical protein